MFPLLTGPPLTCTGPPVPPEPGAAAVCDVVAAGFLAAFFDLASAGAATRAAAQINAVAADATNASFFNVPSNVVGSHVRTSLVRTCETVQCSLQNSPKGEPTIIVKEI